MLMNVAFLRADAGTRNARTSGNVMKRLTSLSLLTLLVTLLGASTAGATTYYARASANWNVNSTWSLSPGGGAASAFPVTGDIANIPVGFTVTIATGRAEACATLNMNSASADGQESLTLAASSSSLTVSGDLNMNANPSYGNGGDTSSLTLNGGSVSIGGNLTLQAGFRSSGSKTQINRVLFTGGGSVTVTGNVSVNSNSSALSVIDMSGGGTLKIGGAFTVNGTFTPGTGTVEYNGTAAQTITTTGVSYNNLTVNDSGATASATANITVAGNLTVTSGTLDLSTFTANRSTSGGTLTVANGATLKIGGTGTLPSNYTTHSFGASSTVNYAGSAQTVSSETYGNLTLSGSGNKTLATTATINGTVEINGTAKFNLTYATGSSSTVGSLTFGGVLQAAGTWGSTSSSAANKTDTYFQGTGKLNVTTGALDHFAVSNPGTVTAGTAFTTTTITAQDLNNNTVTSYTGTVDLTETGNGAGGTVSPGTSGAFTLGVLANPNLTLTKAATSGVTLTATDHAGTGKTGTSGSFTVNPGAIASYVVSASSPQTAGSAFTTTVTAKDANANTVTTDSSTVVTMTGTGSVQFDSNGDSTFGDNTKTLASGTLTISTKDNVAQSITITATSTGGKTGTSSTITINPAAANKLAFTTQPGNGSGGSPFSTQPAVTLQDQYGNTVTGTAQNVTVAIQNNAGPGGTLSGTKTVAVNTGTGVATFSGLSIDKGGNGYTLTATGSTVSTSPGVVVSSPFNVMSAGPVTIGRAWGTYLRIPVSDVTAQIAGGTTPYTLSVTSREGTDYVEISGSEILFAPAGNTNSILDYTVADSSSPTLRATNTITVSVTNAFSSVTISFTGSSLTITNAGIPGYKYVLQRATAGANGPWTDLDGAGGTPDSRQTAPSAGLWTFTDSSPPSPSYYRLRQNN
jgi:hypothetical protein